MYERNVCCHYILSYIMRNKYFYYISSRIRRYTLSCITKLFVAIIHLLNNNNKYFYYTSSRIRQYTLSCIIKIFVVII